MNPKELLKHEGTRKWQEVVAKYVDLSGYKTALDIGTGGGLSSYTIAVNGLGTIISISPESQKNANRFARDTKYENRIKFIKGTSKDFFAKNKSKFNFICIDGSHDYLEVLNDLEESWKILNDKGYIVCDDYGHIKLCKTVGKAIDEWAEKNNLKFEVMNGKAIFHKQ